MFVGKTKKIMNKILPAVLIQGLLVFSLPGIPDGRGVDAYTAVVSPVCLAPAVSLNENAVKSMFRESGAITGDINRDLIDEIMVHLGQSRISKLPSRQLYVEELVTTLKKGNRVQVAFLSIQNFKEEFNDRGAALDNLAKRDAQDKISVAGHEFGDWGIQAMADLLPEFLSRELEKQGFGRQELGKWGTGFKVYNDAKSYWVVFQNAPEGFNPAEVFKEIFSADSEFKSEVVKNIKKQAAARIQEKRDAREISGEKAAQLRLALDEFTTRNFNIYGGISEAFSLLDTDSAVDAASAAHRLDSQALLSAKHAQLAITPYYLNSLVNKFLKEGKIQDFRQTLSQQIKKAIRAPLTRVRKYDKNLGDYINFLRQYTPKGEWESIYRPITMEYREGETDEQLLRAYMSAAASGIPAELTRAQENIFKKIITYSLEPDIQARAQGVIFYGNDRFKDTINYLLERQPGADWSGTFRIGGDEIGKVAWNARTGKLWVFRFDINNLGKLNGQWGVRLGDKIIDEMIRLLDEVKDPRQYMRYIYNYFRNANEAGNNLKDNPIRVTKKDFDFVASRLKEHGERVSDYLQENNGVYQVIQFPPVTVQLFDEKTEAVITEYRSGAAISAGAVEIDANIINKQKDLGFDVSRDYSGLANGRADGAAEHVKTEMKKDQLENNGNISEETFRKLDSIMWSEAYKERALASLPRAGMDGFRNILAEFIVTKADRPAQTEAVFESNFTAGLFEAAVFVEQAI